MIHLPTGPGPVNIRPYLYPHFQKQEIKCLVSKILTACLIRHSTSAFSSLLLVKRKDGSWCFCMAYVSFNQLTIKDNFPILKVHELLNEFHESKYFSKLSLRLGYYQIRMHETDVHKTAFRTNEGYYEFLVMPFGLTNILATFQATMNHLLKPFSLNCVIAFFDDILIYRSS